MILAREAVARDEEEGPRKKKGGKKELLDQLGLHLKAPPVAALQQATLHSIE